MGPGNPWVCAGVCIIAGPEGLDIVLFPFFMRLNLRRIDRILIKNGEVQIST